MKHTSLITHSQKISHKIFELNENENTASQNLQDVAKAMLSRKFITLNVHTEKEERSKINNLSVQKSLKKENN